MGFRFRRSIRVLPGVRLNISKSGVSASLGGRGATVNVGKRGTKATVGLPGTGLSYSTPIRRNVGGGAGGNASSATPGNGCVGAAVGLGLLFAIATCALHGSGPGSNATDPIATSTAPVAVSEPAYIATRSARCRADANATAPVQASFARGAAVAIIDHSSTWSKIGRAEGACWVSSALLSDTPLPAPAQHRAAFLASPPAARHHRRSHATSRQPAYDSGGGCPCSGSQICIGPRGGRYCITSGGNKRYGV